MLNVWRFAWDNVNFMNNLSMVPEYDNAECARITAEIVKDIEAGDPEDVRQYIECVYEVWDNFDDDDALNLLDGWREILIEMETKKDPTEQMFDGFMQVEQVYGILKKNDVDMNMVIICTLLDIIAGGVGKTGFELMKEHMDVMQDVGERLGVMK